MARRSRAEVPAQKFELPGRATIKDLSRGTRTKLALLLALCRGADLLILDEPTSGLDPAMAEDVLQALVGHVAGEEMTVFFSSHQIAEVDQIADHIAIVDRGRLVLAGELDDLRDSHQRVQLVFAGDAPTGRAPRHLACVRVNRQGRVLTVLTRDREALIDGSASARAGLDRLVAGDVEGHLSRIGTNGGLIMLWHKAWLETRWRFITALVILTVMSGAKVYEYVVTLRMMPLAESVLSGDNSPARRRPS